MSDGSEVQHQENGADAWYGERGYWHHEVSSERRVTCGEAKLVSCAHETIKKA